jgi:di/tricarboxylate transporter
MGYSINDLGIRCKQVIPRTKTILCSGKIEINGDTFGLSMLSLIITIFIVLLAVILLSVTRLRPDLIALIVLLTLGLTGIVDQSKIFNGFSSSAVMIILGISMVSVALQQTGAANAIGKLIYRAGGKSEVRLILLVTLFGAALSLFMNNIAAVGVLLPAVMSLSRKSNTPPSRLLMPLAFGTILGGMATLLTTSNIIVSGALKDAGLPSLGLLDFFPVGAPVVIVGAVYLITLGRKLLPRIKDNGHSSSNWDFSERLKHLYKLESNLVRVKVGSASNFANRTIHQGNWNGKANLNVLAILRTRENLFAPSSDTVIKPGDEIIAQGDFLPQRLEEMGLEIEPLSTGKNSFTDETRPLAEVVITPHSQLIGKNLCELNFREKYELNVLGVWREGKPTVTSYSRIPLNFGDALLVQGTAVKIHQLQHDPDLILLDEDPDTVYRPRKIALTVLITLITLGIAALEILPVAQVVLAGAVLLLLTGCMNMNDAFRAIEWKAIFLIAGMWPISIAITGTGLATKLIEPLITIIGTSSPLIIAAIFLLVAMLFTQLVSGPVASIVMIPLVLSASQKLGVDARPLAMAVALGCSLAFLTPLGHPVNIMVMNPGGYTFRDFFRVGFPLTILAIITILTGLHFIWGL